MLFVGGERRPVGLLWSKEKKHPRDGLFFLPQYQTNRKFKHLVQTKPMGENTITNIMKVSVAGTSLKESEKSLRIIVQEKQQSGSWRKQRL